MKSITSDGKKAKLSEEKAKMNDNLTTETVGSLVGKSLQSDHLLDTDTDKHKLHIDPSLSHMLHTQKFVKDNMKTFHNSLVMKIRKCVFCYEAWPVKTVAKKDMSKVYRALSIWVVLRKVASHCVLRDWDPLPLPFISPSHSVTTCYCQV